MERANNIFGYVMYILGFSKFIIVSYSILQLITSLITVNPLPVIDTSIFIIILGFLELSVIVASIILFFVNFKEHIRKSLGYAQAIGAICLEFFNIGIIGLVLAFFQCALFLRAGSKVLGKDANESSSQKRTRELEKSTDWFYSEEREKERIQDAVNRRAGIDTTSNLDEKVEKINFKLDNITTWIMAILIAVIIVMAGVFIYNYSQNISSDINEDVEIERKEIKKEVKRNEVPQNVVIVKKESISEQDVIVDNIVDQRLVNITNIFNDTYSKQMAIEGYSVKATPIKSGITVSMITGGIYSTVLFKLEGDILSADIIINESEPVRTAVENLLVTKLFDSVAQMNGREIEQFVNGINEDILLEYTIEYDGFEITEHENGLGYTYKIDIDSNYPFLD